jgi:hypothetical protein
MLLIVSSGFQNECGLSTKLQKEVWKDRVCCVKEDGIRGRPCCQYIDYIDAKEEVEIPPATVTAAFQADFPLRRISLDGW